MYPIHGLYCFFLELWSSHGSGSRSVTSDPAAFFLSPFRYARMSCISGTQLKLFFQVRCNTYVRMLLSSKNENAIKLHEIYWGLSPPRPAGSVPQGLCSSQDSYRAGLSQVLWRSGFPYRVLTLSNNLLLSNVSKLLFLFQYECEYN